MGMQLLLVGEVRLSMQPLSASSRTNDISDKVLVGFHCLVPRLDATSVEPQMYFC